MHYLIYFGKYISQSSLVQRLERLLDDMKTEIAELGQMLQPQSSEEEKTMVRQQLMRRKAELTRAEETMEELQQQIREFEMKQQVYIYIYVIVGLWSE